MIKEGGEQSGQEDQLEKPELGKALLSPGKRGHSAVPSGNTPQGLSQAEETPVMESGYSSSRWVSQGPLSALGMLSLEFLPPSLAILGSTGTVWIGIKQRNGSRG